MTELPAGLELFRNQLRDAIAHDLERRPRTRLPRSRAGRVAAPILAAAGAAAVVLTVSGGSTPPSADAAIIRDVKAALDGPAGAILHERAQVTLGAASSEYELWVQTAPPHNYRVIKWGHEARGTDGASYDLAASFRSLVNTGQARVDATTSLNGVPAYRLTVTGGSRPFMDGTVYVARSDYRPLLIDTGAYGGERISFQAYEYLRPTATNLRLVAGATTAQPGAAAERAEG